MNKRLRRILIVVVVSVLIGVLMFQSLNFLLITNTYVDKCYSRTIIHRFPKDNSIDVQVIYLYSSNFFLNYFSDLDYLLTDFLIQRNDAGISIQDFFQKYTSYKLSFKFYKQQISYEFNVPDWARTIFPEMQSKPSFSNAEATKKAIEVWHEFVKSKGPEYFKESDAFIVLTDYYFRGVEVGSIFLSMWEEFDPVLWDRVPGWGGSNATERKLELKWVIAHEMCHLFGAFDHYKFGGGENVTFYTDDIMGKIGWGYSFSPNEDPYLDKRILEQEIHWEYLEKEHLYPVPIIISGIVRTAIENMPLSDVYVYFNNTFKCKTDFNGKFTFTLPDACFGNILFKKEGYLDSDGGWHSGRDWTSDEELFITMYENPSSPPQSKTIPIEWYYLFGFIGIIILASFIFIWKKKKFVR
jgi:hypothetical protein